MTLRSPSEPSTLKRLLQSMPHLEKVHLFRLDYSQDMEDMLLGFVQSASSLLDVSFVFNSEMMRTDLFIKLSTLSELVFIDTRHVDVNINLSIDDLRLILLQNPCASILSCTLGRQIHLLIYLNRIYP